MLDLLGLRKFILIHPGQNIFYLRLIFILISLLLFRQYCRLLNSSCFGCLKRKNLYFFPLFHKHHYSKYSKIYLNTLTYCICFSHLYFKLTKKVFLKYFYYLFIINSSSHQFQYIVMYQYIPKKPKTFSNNLLHNYMLRFLLQDKLQKVLMYRI